MLLSQAEVAHQNANCNCQVIEEAMGFAGLEEAWVIPGEKKQYVLPG